MVRAFLLSIVMLFAVQAMAAPTFDNGSPQFLTICQDASATSLNTFLKATDAGGFTFTWTVIAAPAHGTLGGFPAVAASGTSVQPVGTSYTPATGYNGSDAFTIQVADANGSATTTILITINANPLPIFVPGAVCAGKNILVTDGTSGGTFSSSNTGIASVGATVGGTATATGVSAGTATLTYTLGTGCYSTATISVNPSPAPISGSTSVCTGMTTPLSESVGGGTWTSSNNAVGSISSGGVVTGVAAGTFTATYTLPAGCYEVYPMTVYQTPPPITGPTVVCTGSTITLANGTGGGIFSSSSPSNASVGAFSGIVTGVAAGTPTISYTVPNGCSATQVVTVNSTPSALAGPTSVCVGAQATLTDLTPGGTFTSSNTLLATVGGSSGIVTGVAAGVPNITYTAPNACFVTQAMTVNNNPAGIAGPGTVCTGSTITLTDATPSGTFSSSNSGLATVGGGTGVVTGVSTGVPLISYTLATGCYATVPVTVNQTPVATTGASQVCVGSTTTLTNTTGGGTFSASNANATVGASSGIVTGVTAGAVNITYTLSTGCFYSFPMTVNNNPAAITGAPFAVCVGSTITVADATAGGTFTSSNTSVATVGGGSGIITGIASGVSTISYTVGATGCIATQVVTVNSTPAAISGSGNVCVGSTTALSTSPAGGTWTTSNGAIATVSGTGVVTGVSAGTANITYTLGTGCFAATTVTVNPLPAAIAGSPAVCVGSTTALTDGGGGIFTSSNTAQATVGAGTGIVTGVATGNPVITYTLPTGCLTTVIATVNPNPAAIGGTTNTCVGLSSTLNDGTAGGTWTSSNTGVATVVSGTGVVTGVAAGTATITYTLATGCFATTSFVVNPNPAAIGGTLAVCTGATTALTDATGGGTFSSSDITKATVVGGTGVVTGVAAGNATISYTLGTGCYAVATLTINQTPPSITGTNNVCIGLTTALADATPGGNYTSSNTSLATVVAGTGVVTGVAAGTPTITYTLSTGCFTSTPVTVNPNPAAIGGTAVVCVGSTTLLTDATSGGTWTTSNGSLATVGATTGIVTGVAAGNPVITYTLPTGCINTVIVTVNPLPANISGTMSVCTGFTTTLGDATPGGTWTSSNTSLATVSGTGVVTGVAAGTPIISYTLPTGCVASTPVTVNPTPAAITGTAVVCVGSTTTLADATSGGIFTSSNAGMATVGAGTGTVTGISAGTPNITYTVATGCFVSTPVTVNPLPAAITGTTNVCIGLNTTLADATPGGSYTSSNTAQATVVSATGVVTGVSAGTPIITYTLPTGCAVSTPITVNANPTAITGASSVCTGFTTTFASTPGGGTFSSSNGAQASVGASTGIVTGVSAGTPTITYTLSTGCIAVKSIVVNQTPAAIAGTMSVCIGSSTTLTDATTGGTYTSSNTAQATVVSGTGVVTGVAAGIPNITYTMGTGCFVTTPVTVNPNPAAITGPTSVCTGSTIGLSDASAGGTWTSSDITKATVGASSGVVTGVAAGSVTITYAFSTGCQVTYAIVVNTTPLAITGVTNVCTGFTTTLADATVGGTFTSSNTAEATVVGGTGVVTGVSAGTPTITYTMGTGCFVTTPVTVNQNPPATTGTASVCVGLTTVLSNTLAGGTFSTTNPAQATVGSTTGIVNGISAGNPVISYTMSTGCYVLTNLTVNPTPAAITGPTVVCVGSNITMNDATSGGLWSSGNTGIATIVAATGVVTGVSAGSVNITYMLGGGCIATTTITVNPVPNISNFTSTIATSQCVGGSSTVTVSSTSLGVGSFSVTYNLSGANAVTGATATLTMGATNGTFTIPAASLTGTGSTTVTITAISNGFGCTSVPLSNNTSTFSIYPLPTVYNVTGGGGYCAGGTGVHIFLSNSVGGVNYQLYQGSTPVGAPVAGTFSGLDFGLITAVGTYSVSATNATTGCTSNMFGSVTVFTNPLPTAFTVTGGGNYCAGGTGVPVGLSGSTGGINYQLFVGGVSTGSPVAGSGSAITFGNQTAAGVYTVVATNTSTTCTNNMTGSATVVINPLPAAITGTMTLCPGTTTTLSDATTGGTWTSSTPSVATVGSATGVVAGVAPGTSIITYTLSTGCAITTVVTVNPLPSAISGLNTVCVGSGITLADATSGGTFTSSNTGLATVNITSGAVTGIAAGTPTITYALSTGCYVTFPITVNPIPAAISGANNVCVGQTATALNSVAGGVWSSSTPSTATIGSATGVVTGITAGTLTLTYTLPAGCFVTAPFTVNPTPAAITGTASTCVGSTTTLADATSGGAFTSSNTAIASVNSVTGVVTGAAAGTATITYTLPAGCFVTTLVTINPTPAAVAGTNNVCAGLTVTLTDATAGGTFTSSNTAFATVGGSTGIVTGVAAGTINITYTLGSCFVVFPMTVNALPAAITGTTGICIGATTTLADATTGGTWTSSNPSIASIGSATGVVTGAAVGNATITYTLATGCINTVQLTVNPLPAAITGVATVCVGSTTTLSDASAGGTWTSSNNALATVGTSSGILTGVAAGNPVITYTLATGCIATTTATVYPVPAAIVGGNAVCVGSSITLTDAVSGGTWTSSNPGLASVGSTTGVVTGIATGTPMITYSLPSPGGCFATLTVSVNPQPVGITGVFTVCSGSSTTLSDATTGGTWTSANTAIGTVNATSGAVTGISAGSVTISYTLPGGCFVTTIVTVYPTPVAITGTPNVCIGLTTSLSDLTAGGIWTSSNTAQATIGSVSGVVTGISTGTPTITYTLAPGGCIAIYPITVNPLPVAITGTTTVCVGGNSTLTDANPGGSFSSSTPSVATIGGATGIITGVAAGTTVFTYALPTGCITTVSGTVNPLPGIFALTGGGAYCAGGTGTTIGLSGSEVGVNYQAMIGTTNMGSAVAGTGAAISFGPFTTAGTYTVVAVNATTSCTSNMSGTATIAVSVLPTVFNLTGGGGFCAGGIGVPVGLNGSTNGVSYQLLFGGTPVGTPQAGTGGTINFGNYTGAGTYTVLATNSSTGCSRTMAGTAVITVNPLPTAFTVTGGGAYCTGGTGVHIFLSGSTVGVNYTLSGIGTVLPGTGAALDFGFVTTAGTYTVSANNATTGCTNAMTGSAIVSISALPSTFTVGGGGAYCAGGTGLNVTLSGSQTTATYQLVLGTTPTGAALTGTGGSLTFPAQVAAGTYTVVATTTVSGCTATMTGSATITINPLPRAFHVVSGSGGSICPGGSTTISLDSTVTGVSYKLYNGAALVSTIAGTGSGITYTGLSAAGIYSVTGTYTTPATGCIAAMIGTATISVATPPTVYLVSISGSTSSYCAGGSGLSLLLSNSDLGVRYQLFNGGTALGAPVTGTGSGLTFGPVTAGTYSIVGTNITSLCTSNMAGTPTVSVNPLPTAYTVGGGGSYCAGGTGVAVSLSNSAVGVSYQLVNTGVPVTGAVQPGTGGPLNFGLQTAVGVYTVVATNAATGCTNNMLGSAVITINSLPVVNTVTGGGSYCAGGTGVAIGLDGSVNTNKYQLYNGGTMIGTAVTGTGAALSFGLQTLAGTYTVVATSLVTSCTNNMAGTAVVTINSAPAVYNVTGGGGYCSGGTGIAIGVSGSDTGVTYQLLNSGVPVTSATGTGAAVSFGLVTTAGSYTVRATRTITGCTSIMTGSATVSVNPLPATHTVTGGGAYCPGGAGVVVGLDGTEVGINYQLVLGFSPVGTAVAGTGGVISFGLQTGTGTYTVRAVSATTGCSLVMTGTAVVSLSPLPAAYTVTGGGGYCVGGTGANVMLSGSSTGVNYTLLLGTTAVGSAVAGTGSALNFGPQTGLGSYSVMATSTITSCSATMTGTVTVSLNPLPVAYAVTGGGSYCAGGTGLAIGLTSSDATISYQLMRDGAPVGPALAGTGAALSFGLQTVAGTYTVAATNSITTCTNTMLGSQTISINALPVVYLVTGGGSYCAGGVGVHVNLSTSDAGINYQLKKDGVATGSTFAGLGGPLDFGAQTAAGSYTVSASDALTGCTSNMTGSATVSVNPLPVSAYVVTGGGNYCEGGTGLTVGLSGSTSGISYQLYNGTAASGAAVTGTGGTISFGLHTASGTYTVVASNTATTCTSTMTGSVAIVINPLPIVDTVTGGGNYCPGGVGNHIGLSSSSVGVNYQLYRGILPLGAPVAGTGSGLDFGLQSVVGTYFVKAIDATSGCSINMVGSPSIGISTLPVAYTVAGSATGYCLGGSGVDLTLSGSEVGTQYQLYMDMVATGPSMVGTGFLLDFGLHTSAGTYSIIATNPSTSCTNNMTGTPSITINALPSTYAVTGGGGFCAGGTGVHVMLDGSDMGVNYRLYRDGIATGTPAAGTGFSLDFGTVTAGGTYTAVATDATTGCTSNMLSSASVQVNPLPVAYFVVGGGSYCAGTAGVHVGVNSSDSGITYQLYLGTSAVGSPLSGTGAALDFGVQSAAGAYSVMAVNTTTSCMSNMSGTVTVSVNAAPATYTVTGGGNYCTGGTGVHIGLTGSTAGINYTVVGTGVTAAGTGAALDFGLFTSATSYTVNAVNPATGCAADMTGSVSVSISPLPAVYTVTGGGSYCASTSGVAVGLSSSDLGINYQLYNGTSTVGGPVAGVGGPLNFGLHTAGTYTVVAINATTTCTRNMTGTATVTVLPSVVPSVTVVSGAGDTVCTGTSVTFTALPVNGGSLPGYQWSVNGAIVTGATTNNYTYVPANGNVVGVTLTSSATCPLPATASGSVTMTVRANVLPTVAITANPGNNVCQGTTVDLMATTTFGGIAPSFSWKVNGAPSGSGSTFSYIPMDGDVVFAVMTSSYQCVSALSVLSNNISFTTQSNVAPTVTLTMTSGTNSGNILYNDTVVAAVVNGGSNPVYQWTVNGVVVPGATTAVLYRSTLNDMDVVSCQVADSNACGYLVGAGSITVHSSNVGVTPVPAATASDMHLMPNPNKGTFTIRGTLASTEDQDVTIEVTDVLGQVIYANRVATHNGVIEEKVQMTTTLANGMYMVSIRSANESKVFHMVVEQ